MIPTLSDLENVWVDLGDDERRVLYAIARRVRGGQRTYGLLNIATDKRDWRQEEHEEHLDATVYAAIRTLKEQA